MRIVGVDEQRIVEAPDDDGVESTKGTGEGKIVPAQPRLDPREDTLRDRTRCGGRRRTRSLAARVAESAKDRGSHERRIDRKEHADLVRRRP